MFLALDLGNSRLKAGLFNEAGELVARRDIVHGRRPECLSGNAGEAFRPGPVSRAAMASVAPALEEAADRWCLVNAGVSPRLLCSRDVPLKIRVQAPGRVGMDRLVNGAAGFLLHGGPVVTIDCGSALTFDLVDETGAFDGGVIAPSPETCRRGLREASDLLPEPSLTAPRSVVGKNTSDAMRSGLVFGFAELTGGILRRLEQEWRPAFRLVATGGGIIPLLPFLPPETVHDPDLTLRGVFLCASGGKEKTRAGKRM